MCVYPGSGLTPRWVTLFGGIFIENALLSIPVSKSIIVPFIISKFKAKSFLPPPDPPEESLTKLSSHSKLLVIFINERLIDLSIGLL